jgi:hypothetical protein
MNNSDLDAKLKSVCVPERTEDYWNDFPSQVRVNLHRSTPAFVPQNPRRSRLVWAGGWAVALALVFVCLQFHPLKTASNAITKNERHIRTQLAQLDAGLHVLMFNPHGMGYLLAEAN